ncbi:nucleoside 2-deoxyribosyltransferase [Candidatus Parcubacteria bacterium]|nr:nucleoside 2-deoxyribosyltransferase [Candidatus Parcubacteria bacterium]
MKSVVLCSSRRFATEAKAFMAELEKAGAKTFIPPLQTWTMEEWGKLSKREKQTAINKLTLDHFDKIDAADVVFLYNPGGYAGVSVSLELGYAHAKSKPIYALENDPEYARNSLFKEYTSTPNDLIKYLT